MVDRRGQLPTRQGAREYYKRDLDGIIYLVIHHSGVAVDSTAEAIARYHTEVLGWPGIGYHFLVHQDGVIEQVNGLETMSYNVASRNQEVIGICLLGDFTDNPPGEAQLESSKRLLDILRPQFIQAQVVGHREIALAGHETACPGETFLAGPHWKERL